MTDHAESAAGRFRLVAKSGPILGRAILLNGPLLYVGRHRENDVVVPDAHMSRQHARLEQRDGKLIVTDCGSSNGTLVNGVTIHASTPLEPGDVLEMGETRLLVERVEPANRPAAATDHRASGFGDALPADPGRVWRAPAGPELGAGPSADFPKPFSPGPRGRPAPAAGPDAPAPIAPRPPTFERHADAAPDASDGPAWSAAGPMPGMADAWNRPDEPPYEARATFGRRLLAYLVDAAIVSVVAVTIVLVVLGPFLRPFFDLGDAGDAEVAVLFGPLVLALVVANLLTFAASAAYWIVGWVRFGTTPGLRLLGLAVVTMAGTPPTTGQAVARFIGYLVCSAALGIGFLWILRPERRGWHDLMAGTYVVEAWAADPRRW